MLQFCVTGDKHDSHTTIQPLGTYEKKKKKHSYDSNKSGFLKTLNSIGPSIGRRMGLLNERKMDVERGYG